MKIEVIEPETDEDLRLEFVNYGPGSKRLWIRDPGQWWQTVGWCPHLNFSGFECTDCSLNVE